MNDDGVNEEIKPTTKLKEATRCNKGSSWDEGCSANLALKLAKNLDKWLKFSFSFSFDQIR